MAKEEAPRKKKAFSQTQLNAYLFDPSDLVLVETKDAEYMASLYDPDVHLPVDEGLTRSIMFQGVLEPVIVTKGPDGRAYVADGRSRVKAAREANKRLAEQGKDVIRVPCVPKRGTESDLYGIALAANEHRHDITPLARAEKCARYLALGRTDEEAAIVFGVSVSCIGDWMMLLELAPPVRRAIETGKITAKAARQLHQLPEKEQGAKLAAILTGNAEIAAAADPVSTAKVDKRGKPKAKTADVMTSDPAGSPVDPMANLTPEEAQRLPGFLKHRLRKTKKKPPTTDQVRAVVKGEVAANEAVARMQSKTTIKKVLADKGPDLDKLVRGTLLWVLGERKTLPV